MLDKIDLAGLDAKRPGDILDRPFFQDITIEDLEMFGLDLRLDATQGGVKKLPLPFLFPNGVQFYARRIGNALDSGRAGWVAWGGLGYLDAPILFAEVIVNAAAGNEQQPPLEGTGGRIVFEMRHLPRHGDHCVLDDILRFGDREA